MDERELRRSASRSVNASNHDVASVVEKDLRGEPLDATRHDRGAFVCGAESLEGYLKAQATQDVRR